MWEREEQNLEPVKADEEQALPGAGWRDVELPLEPELFGLERSLRSLVPRADGLDKARLLFLAGQASVRRKERCWQLHLLRVWAVAATLAAVVMGVFLVQAQTTRGQRQTPTRQLGAVREAPAHQSDREQRGQVPGARLPSRQPTPSSGVVLSVPPSNIPAATIEPGTRFAQDTTSSGMFDSRRDYVSWVSELLLNNLDPWCSPRLPRDRLQEPRRNRGSYAERMRALIEEFYGSNERPSWPPS